MKLNDDVKFAILLIAVILSMVCMFLQPKYPVAYDCRIAEFSPDVPPAVKEQCRKRWLKSQGNL
jgi:hypothetical protein